MSRFNFRLPSVLFVAGLVLIFFHDYAYRRADTLHTGDYELNGLLTHAGTDMLGLTVVLTSIAFFWLNWQRRP